MAAWWDDPAPIVDPLMTPREQIQTLQGIALGINPMHPKAWERLKAEADKIVEENPELDGMFEYERRR